MWNLQWQLESRNWALNTLVMKVHCFPSMKMKMEKIIISQRSWELIPKQGID